MKMKTKLFFCILFFFVLGISDVMGQGDTFKSERVTYLWDVTLSMKGYNGSENIYARVLNDLIGDIELIEDENTEIVVVPFQVDVCEVFRAYATQEGKERLIGKLREYNNTAITNTDIAKPLKYVIDHVFTADRIDYLMLLTDGTMQNMQPLYDLLNNEWDKKTKNMDVYSFYVMLTDKAIDEKLDDIIDDRDNMDVVLPSEDCFPAFISPKSSVRINVRDEFGQKSFAMSFNAKRPDNIPEGYKIRLHAEANSYINVNCELDFGTEIKVPVEYQMPLTDLAASLPVDVPEEIEVFIEAVYKDPSVRWVESSFKLRLVNKPEKTMRFYVK